jgi:hypothetical protein
VCLVNETGLQYPGTAPNAGVADSKRGDHRIHRCDCIATPTSISEVVVALTREEAALVATNIRWLYSSSPRAAEISDSLVDLRNDVHARENGTAVTGIWWSRLQCSRRLVPFLHGGLAFIPGHPMHIRRLMRSRGTLEVGEAPAECMGDLVCLQPSMGIRSTAIA